MANHSIMDTPLGRRALRSVRGTLVVGLVMASLPLVAVPAAADDFAPTMSRLQRTSSALLGSDGTVSISFDAADEGAAGLAWAMFSYRTPLGAELRVDAYMSRAASGTFTATRTIGIWAASGSYVLEKVDLRDLESNMTVYERSSSSHLDFAAADFEVDNPLEDTTVPTITSATLFQKSVIQGTPVVVLYVAQDDLSGVESVVFSGWSPTGGQYWISSLPKLGAVGPATWIVPMEAAAGNYESFIISVHDRAGNYLSYRPEARYGYPPQARVPEHPSPDIRSLDFTVQGVVGDRNAPAMTSLSMLTPRIRRPGDLVALDFSASDAGTGIEQVAAQWIDGKGHYLDVSKTCGDRTTGPLSTEIEDYRTIGSEWRLDNIGFADYLGNQVHYRRDGAVAYQNSDPGVLTHSFDLSVGDFTLEAGTPSTSDLVNTTRQWCPKVGEISLEVEDPTVGVGELITPEGEVSLGDVPIPDPIVAIHEYIDGVPGLVGVVQGNASGAYEDVFAPQVRTVLQATFLGTEGPLGAQPSASERVPIFVGSTVTATVNPDRITRGQSSTISGMVDPAEGAHVWLQRRFSWGWKDMRSTASSPDGSYRFTLKPRTAGTYRYRVLRPGTHTLAVARSPVRTLTVR